MRLIDADALHGRLDDLRDGLDAKYDMLMPEGLVRATIDGLTTVELPRWISVDDRLPKVENTFFVHSESLPVLVCCDNMLMLVAWLRYEDGEPLYWSTIEAVLPLEEVTHWMPLPEPPKEVKSDGNRN